MFVKICGTTSEEDALLSVAMGADALGFIFAPSPRQIAPGVAADIVKRLPPEVLTVGVFRNEAPERVVEITHRCGLKAVQLHGRETPAQSRWVRERVAPLIKGFAAGDLAVGRAEEYGADIVLIDNPQPGSGQLFDWSLADGLAPGARLLLAGGLNPDNVAAAIAAVHPWGVDVVTGVEREPGRKDPTRLREFIAAARTAETPGYETDEESPYDWQDE